jgi:hypothetical protein
MTKFLKFVNIDQIIEKCHRDFELTQFSRDDAAEWAWECLGKLGAVQFLKEKMCIIEMMDHRGTLPDDFMTVQSVRTYRDKYVLNQTSYEFWKDYRGYRTESKTIDDGVNKFNIVSDDYNNWEEPASKEIGVFEAAGTHWGNYGQHHHIHANEHGLMQREKYVFKIDGDYIYSGLKDRALEISYLAVPVFNDYTPQIPDDERVKYAVEATIVYKILQREWVKGNVSLQMKREFEPEYLFAIASARNKAVTPDEEDWELLKNRAMAIIKSHKAHDNSYAMFGTRINNFLDKSV